MMEIHGILYHQIRFRQKVITECYSKLQMEQ
nr:MAG TPA: hypothetical protein [Bacteriophage sp.]DAL65233.1 MAG TPA_asm: hypothetical protein [Caudoviricetes sp.]